MDAVVDQKPLKFTFSRYQKFVVGILAFLQFTIILDFMIISPLGAIVIPELHISPRQFGWAVSSYAFSAAISGISAAGFADRFDRKRLLLFFYGGFILGTALCALAPSYHFLLLARIVTGLFGGVIGSIVLAIATDLFPLEMRGRVMGFIQTAFAAAQVLGLPAGIYFANVWSWHAPFVAIVLIGLVAGLVIVLFVKPIDGHLKLKQEHSPWSHLVHTLLDPRYTLAFIVTAFMNVGGYLMMPFLSAFIVGPTVGKISDRFGKLRTFLVGTALMCVMVVIWTNLGPTPLPIVIVTNVVMFMGIFSRLIPFQA